MARTASTFATIRTEGSLLPADFLQRLLQPKADIDGLRPEDYHLVGRERIDDAVSRAWLRLFPAWTVFRDQLQRLSEDDTATTITREKWLYVLFSELGYGRLEPAKGLTAEGKPYPISHLWRNLPLHLVGANIDLETRTRGAVGAATMSPHGLVQEYLNRSDEHLWGVVSNGRVLRILRDNAAMTRQAFVEFDLEAMFEGQQYHDFVLLWMLLHQSRFEAERPEECWLEQWLSASRSQGTRALDALRGGVEAAITALGTGLVSHRVNTELKNALRDGSFDKTELYREVLRVVYQLIFLFAAEDRELVFAPDATPQAKECYRRHYSVSRLRWLAQRRRGDAHTDLWQQLLLTFNLYATGDGEAALGIPFYGGLFRSANPLITGSQIASLYVLEAIRALTTVADGKSRRRVDYRNMGAEELGSVYESLLEQHPDVSLELGSFSLGSAAGSERKTTGSYYTPASLITLLLDSALDPVLTERIETARKEKRNVEEAILEFKVCDPACGSGHFLIAAAHRVARELAKVRTGDDEPSPAAQRHALRDVVSHCIYGVDINPMAVELTKVGLWLEAIEPGKPLTFLDHHIKCGNSLLGATPALIERGIPDAAFDPIEGDDKKVASSYKARNKAARGGQMDLLAAEEPADYGTQLTEGLRRIDAMPEDTPEQLAEKERRYRAFAASNEHEAAMTIADAYCAAFVWPAQAGAPAPVTQGVLEGARDGSVPLKPETAATVTQLASGYAWFHWHLEYPDVFTSSNWMSDSTPTGWDGGFDCVLGNPPWERIKLQEKEFFAQRDPSIAGARNATQRKRLIAALAVENPMLCDEYNEARRIAEGESHYIRSSGRYPLSGRGDVNTYGIFAELACGIAGTDGRIGIIVPTGIATDDTLKYLFGDLVSRRRLVSLYDFRNKGFFPDVAGAQGNRFCLLTVSGPGPSDAAMEFLFRGERVGDLLAPGRRFSLTPGDIALINPNTLTCPVFLSQRDAEITLGIYRRLPVLVDESDGSVRNPWGIEIRRVFDMNKPESLAACRSALQVGRDAEPRVGEVRMYESKMMHQYDHRYGDYGLADVAEGAQVRRLPQAPMERLADSEYESLPRYWVRQDEVVRRLGDVSQNGWLLVWRDIASSLDERTFIGTILPACGTDFTLRVNRSGGVDARSAGLLLAGLNSFCLDFIARQSVGGTHVSDYITKQLAFPDPAAFARDFRWTGSQSLGDWLMDRVVELVYTAESLAPFAAAVGYDGPPFIWHADRRFELRCELDAAFFHLYSIERDDVDHIMDSFWIVRAADEKRFGEYRTKRRILELYDEYGCAVESVSGPGRDGQ